MAPLPCLRGLETECRPKDEGRESECLQEKADVWSTDASSDLDSSPDSASSTASFEDDDVAGNARGATSERHRTGELRKSEATAIFCLSGLLSLQASISRSFEMAMHAFLSDAKTSEALTLSSRQAIAAWQHTSNVVRNYASVARQVSQCIIPDIRLGAQESEPSLIASLAELIVQWVDDSRTAGDGMHQQYIQLHLTVQNLLSGLNNARDSDFAAGALLLVRKDVGRALDICAEVVDFWKHMREATLELSRVIGDAEEAQQSEIRLDEYARFWETLERLCVQYCDRCEGVLENL